MIANGGGNRLLQVKSGQGRYLRRIIIVGCAITPYGSNGQDQVADLALFLQPAAFAKKQHRLWADGLQQIHNGRRIGTAHPEIDNGNAICRGIGHGTVLADHRYIVPGCKQINIIIEIGKQDIFPESIQR